jgi:hypothetical protein
MLLEWWPTNCSIMSKFFFFLNTKIRKLKFLVFGQFVEADQGHAGSGLLHYRKGFPGIQALHGA